MKLGERLNIQRDVSERVRRKHAQGKDAKTIRAEIKAEMKEKYGADVNWDKILEIIIAVLSVLLKVL